MSGLANVIKTTIMCDLSVFLRVNNSNFRLISDFKLEIFKSVTS